MLGAYKEGDRLINKILVTPKRKADPCFSGVLSIVEDNWNIHSLELYLTKSNGYAEGNAILCAGGERFVVAYAATLRC